MPTTSIVHQPAIRCHRNIVSSVAMRTQRETEEKERVLAEQVARATLEQIKHKFELDMACLQSRLPTAESQAKEAALDSRYLAQRQATLVLIMAFMFGLTQIHVFLVFSEPRKGQKHTKDYTAKCLCFQSANRQIHVFLVFSELRKGQKHTKDYMEKHCKVFVLPECKSSYPAMFPEIAQFIAKVQQDMTGGGQVSLGNLNKCFYFFEALMVWPLVNPKGCL